ncbi:MAG: hypothetical protein JW982_10820 [Spirochaetes bacterium]|nr:hypothetical protein [Spirochaetota bacterium]
MTNKRKIFMIVSMFILSAVITNASAQPAEYSIVRIDDAFVNKVLQAAPIERDEFIDTYLEKLVFTRGYVERVVKKNIYKQTYCIELIDSLNSSRMNFKYHLYTENKEFTTLLEKGDLFEFKGQFVMYTPVSLKKDIYIFDIILQDGALVVE